jgi:alpha-ketoglutarate-dependent taurine dioxygenase
LDATFGAIVRGIELRALDDEAWGALHDLWLERALLIFPGQFLTQDEQNAFALRFGALEFPATQISNIGRSGKVHYEAGDDVVKGLRGNEGWHHDSTYMPVQAKGAVFSAEIVPSEGAATGFADMRAAYEALDDATRERIDGLAAYHSRRYSMDRADLHVSAENADRYQLYGYDIDIEPPLRPLVKVHPATGRPNLLIGQHAYAIAGLTADESETLLDRLNDDACIAPRTYHHQWTVGDTVVWDNRRLMHRATPFDMTQPRRMWHTRIAGERASELAQNV